MNTYFNRLSILIFVLLIQLTASSQSITMSFPQSIAYVNTIPVQWSISPSNTVVSEITLTFTYTTGFYSALSPVYVLKLKSKATSGRFTMQPLTIKSDTINFVNPPSQILDGSYTVRMTYKRSDNLTFTSNSTSLSSSTITLPPIINSPVNNKRVKQQIPLNYILPSTPSFSGYPVTIRMLGSPDTANIKMSSATTINTQLDAHNLGGNAIAVRTLTGKTSLSDGNYQMILSYFDALNHPAASDTVDFILDTHTETPIISSPQNGHTYGLQLPINFTLPELPLAGSTKLIFDDGTSKDSLILKNLIVGQNSFTLDLHNLLGSSFVQSASHNRLNGTSYSIKLVYQDTLSNLPSSTTVNFNIDNTTEVPILNSPINNQLITSDSLISISFNLPEAPLTNSVYLIFKNASAEYTLHLNTSTQGLHQYTIDPSNIQALPALISSNSSIIEDSIYSVYVEYQDTLNNLMASSNVSRINVSRITPIPQLILPGNHTEVSDTLTVSFVLPSPALHDSVQLTLASCTPVVINLRTFGSGLQTFKIIRKQIELSNQVLSASRADIVGGIYSLILSYQDIHNNGFAHVMQDSISMLNYPPTAGNVSVIGAQNADYVFRMANFNYTDADNDLMSFLKITTLPNAGILFKDVNTNGAIDNGEVLSINDTVTKSSIDGGQLTFRPAINAIGNAYAIFGFKVNDGKANSISAYTLTINVLYPTSNESGDWSTASSWNTRSIPILLQNARVKGNDTIVVNNNTTIHDLKLDNGGIIQVTGTAVLTIEGDLYDGLGNFSIAPRAQVVLKGNILDNQGTIKVVNTSTNGMEIKGNVHVPQGSDG